MGTPVAQTLQQQEKYNALTCTEPRLALKVVEFRCCVHHGLGDRVSLGTQNVSHIERRG